MLEDYRKKIEDLDAMIITLLAKRFDLVDLIGDFKRQTTVRIEDKDREAKLLAMHKELAEKEGMDPAIVAKIYELIFEESKKRQKSDE